MSMQLKKIVCTYLHSTTCSILDNDNEVCGCAQKFFYILFLLINSSLNQQEMTWRKGCLLRASVWWLSSLWLFFLLVQNLKPGKKEPKKGRVHCPLKIDGGAEPKKVKSARSYKCTRALSEKAFPDWLLEMSHYSGLEIRYILNLYLATIITFFVFQ